MKLFDADELKEWVENWFETNRSYHPHSKANNIPIPELYDILERMPTVEAEPVRRCKDCKWHEDNFCTNFNVLGFGIDDYCSLGAKMDEGNT